MLSIATDGVAWSVGVSVCWSRLWALQKLLNRSRCGLGVDLGGLKEPCVRWGSRYTDGTGQFWGVIRPTEKHWESLLQCTQQKGQFNFQQRHDVRCGLSSTCYNHLFIIVLWFRAAHEAGYTCRRLRLER